VVFFVNGADVVGSDWKVARNRPHMSVVEYGTFGLLILGMRRLAWPAV